MSSALQQTCYRVLPGRYDLFALVAADPQNYPALLQSSAQSLQQHNHTSRYDILFCYPRQTLCKLADGRVLLDDKPIDTKNFLNALDTLWRAQQHSEVIPADLPFRGGWLLYLGYELAGEIEPVLVLPRGEAIVPVAQAMRVGAAIIYDHEQDQTVLVAEPDWAEQLDEIESRVRAAQRVRLSDPVALRAPLQEDLPRRYTENVARILAYIRDGDVFQVNLSRRWHTPCDAHDIESIYRQLCTRNPGPFAGYMQLGQTAILSSSPERLVEVRQGQVATRPIAGTRPRHAEQAQDTALIAELIAHPKERAEHVMLIDLERNDLGRICVPGSVQVDERMIVESYAHVHHIVSNITGRLRADVSPADVIAAVFPGGTITGCPKVRCMEIIAELEAEPRGPYTGSFGYLNHNGDMDLNILIRTMVYSEGELSFRAGAGIVADSIPDNELAETRAKARGMLLALNGAASA